MTETRIFTYRFRVKNLNGELNRMAKAVNFVWNFCNDTQRHALRWAKRWPSGYDLQRLTSGTSVDLGLHSSTIGAVCAKYFASRRQQRRSYLRYRGRKSLGWIPLKAAYLKLMPDGFRFRGKVYRVFMSRPLPDGAAIIDGSSFSRDSRGRWYLNVAIRVQCALQDNPAAVGIDLGLKRIAALSDGSFVEAPRCYRTLERKLSVAQRANKRRRARNIHLKIAAKRRDFLHKASTTIAEKYGLVAVGNVSASKLAKTKMAKSVLDAGWSDFRNMLRYKAIGRGGKYLEIDEANTTRCCSECGSLSGPKGRKALGIREWICSDCGEPHERDHNAAKNILRLGHQALSVGAAT